MDSFEVNKIIGALLGVVFVIFSVSLISDSLFASPEPVKPGYIIEAAEGAGAAGAGEAKKDEVADIKPMLASADIDKGKAVFKRCAACHTDDQTGANKVGPNLWGVVDRPIGEHEGFSYSSAMKDFSQGGKELWTYDHLNHFLDNPKKLVPGTAMGFAGLSKAEDRANVIAYLRTQADSPVALPSADAAAEAPAGDASADKAEGGDAAKAPAADAGKTEEAAPAAKTDDQDKAPAAKEGEQSAPAAETPKSDTGATGGDAAEPKQDEGSGSGK